MLSRYGGKRCIAFIATEVAIKEPHVGGSIQSSTLKTKCQCANQVKQLFDKQNHHRGITHSQISEKWFLDMLACHGRAFVNHLHFKM